MIDSMRSLPGAWQLFFRITESFILQHSRLTRLVRSGFKAYQIKPFPYLSYSYKQLYPCCYAWQLIISLDPKSDISKYLPVVLNIYHKLWLAYQTDHLAQVLHLAGLFGEK